MDFNIKKTVDKQFDIINALNMLKTKEVLVGIPEANSPRKAGQITNAQLAFIHSNGSPIKNIPARPFIQPAINKNKAIIAQQFGQATLYALEGNQVQALNCLKKAGMIGMNASRAWFTDDNNGWSPLAESTIQARLRQYSKGTKTKYSKMLNQGLSPFRPLIDTGELRKSITYIIRG